MTAYTGRTKYILGEFGIGFTLVVAVLAAYSGRAARKWLRARQGAVEARFLNAAPWIRRRRPRTARYPNRPTILQLRARQLDRLPRQVALAAELAFPDASPGRRI